ncbi:DUF3631 domain-containing protein [Nitrosococcus wardiae]|nr:DUF3631 domain-containing protein [Nitrosococcus wardiae]
MQSSSKKLKGGKCSHKADAIPTDFNGLHQLEGLEEVKRQLPESTSFSNNSRVTDGTEILEQAVTRLAALKPLEYEQVREVEAQRFSVRVVALDKEVERVRRELGGKEEGPHLGREITFDEPEPWPEPVNGNGLLNEVKAVFNGYLVLPPMASSILAAWTVHTYLINAAHATPYLHISSPQPQCGKSTLLDLLEALVYRSFKFASASPSAIFRVIEEHHPTLLIDEADSFLKENEDLRGILNDGYKPNGSVLRTVSINNEHQVRAFSTWGAKAIAGIGNLPTTIADRSIEITLKRKLPTEKTKRLRLRTIGKELLPLRRRIVRWVEDNKEAIAKAEPLIPDELSNRREEVWETLFAIADCAGGDWPKVMRQIAGQQNTSSGDQPAELQLLADILSVFEDKQIDRIFSNELVDALIEMEDRPWGEWRRGKPITSNLLSKLLKPFKIKAKQVWISPKNRNGYLKTDFDDAYIRYVGFQRSRTLKAPSGKNYSHFQNSRGNEARESHKPPESALDEGSRVLEFQSPEFEGKSK